MRESPVPTVGWWERGQCVRAQCSVIQRQMYGAKTDASGVPGLPVYFFVH